MDIYTVGYLSTARKNICAETAIAIKENNRPDNISFNKTLRYVKLKVKPGDSSVSAKCERTGLECYTVLIVPVDETDCASISRKPVGDIE